MLILAKENTLEKAVLKQRIDKICAGRAYVGMGDFDKALEEMLLEGLILSHAGRVQLTELGAKLGAEWRSLLLKKEPILEVVAGIADGSVTGLVVILTAFTAGLATSTAAFAAFLTLAAVAITNFSSFLLGGITEDLADLTTLQTLMDYSLSDIPHEMERDKSLVLVKQLFTLLHREISRSNIYAAILCGVTTFLAGSIPIVAYLLLPEPLDIILSLSIVGIVVGVFLVFYRSKKTRVHWKVTLFETVVIITIAVIASLLLGGNL